MRWCSSYIHEDYIEFQSFDSAWRFFMLTWPIKWHAFMSFLLCDPLCQILTRRIHPFLFVGLKISSHDKTRCSLIKFSHDLLSPCNLCLLVVLENQPPIHFLTSWWAIQIINLSWIVPVRPVASPARIARWKSPFSIGIAQESDYDTLPNGWSINWGTQPKGKMSCLESCCYD
jgi:hypothetical protein